MALEPRQIASSDAITSRMVTLPSASAAIMAGLNLGTITLTESPDQTEAQLSRTAEQIFDDFSTARSAPAVTYYVSPTGATANTGLSEEQAFRRIHEAVTALNNNAVASTGKIVITGGTTEYDLSTGWGWATLSVSPQKDVAFISQGGDVVTRLGDTNFAPTVDATDTNTYSATIANATQVIDLASSDRYGRFRRMVSLATTALVNITPGSWSIVSGTWKGRRSDGAAITKTNTRVLRKTNHCTIANNINVYFGSEDGSRFRIQGGDTGAVRIAPSSLGSSKKCVVLTNVEALYGFRCISVESFHGYVLNFNGETGASVQDGINVHNAQYGGAAECVYVGINESAIDCGSPGQTSCNAFTGHENVWIFALGGYYALGAGGTVRSIGTSGTVMIGSIIDTDRGDIWTGGSQRPTLFRIDAGSTGYLDGVRFKGGAATTRVYAAGTVYERNRRPSSMKDIVVSGGQLLPWA